MRDRFLAYCVDLALNRPALVLGLALLLAVLGGGTAMAFLRLNANTDDLIAPDRPYMKSYREFLDSWGDLEPIWVVVEHQDQPDKAQLAVDALGLALRAEDNFSSVHWKIPAAEQAAIATRAMPQSDLDDLAEAKDAFPALLSSGNTGTLMRDARQRLNRLIAAGAFLDDKRQRRLAAAAFLETDILLAALPGAEPNSASPRSAAEFYPQDEYLKSNSGRFFYLRVDPDKNYGTLAVIEEPLAKLRARLADLETRFPELSFGLTGKPVLQADEMATTDRDMTRASIAAILLVALLFMLIIGGIVRPLLAVASLLIAILWTFGFATLAVGQLNLLSVVFTLVLVGIGIDFGVHVVARYLEASATLPRREAIREAVMRSGRGNLSGAITSSLAFFMATLTGFRGLEELGIIAGSGLLLCALSMTVVLPALLSFVPQRVAKSRKTSGPPNLSPKPFSPKRGRLVLGGLAVFTMILIGFLPRLRFDDNILELQAADLDSVHWERRILEEEGAETWFGASISVSREELRQKNEAAAAESAIGSTHSVLDFIAPRTDERLARRAAIASASAAAFEVEAQDADWDAKDLEKLSAAYRRLARLVGKKSADDLPEIQSRLSSLEALAAQPKASVDASVARGMDFFRRLIRGNAASLRKALPVLPRRLFVDDNNRLLLMMHPASNIWDLENMEKFVAAMRRVDAKVTGAPITHLESIRDMRSGFVRAALFAFIAVFLVMLLDFRNLGLTLLAILPLGLAGLWLCGLMGLLGLSFNLANFFSVPILIGIGVDNGIHLVHRWRENEHELSLGATRRAVLMTSLTTAVGFGCLATASHLGLRSLGYIMALGSLCILASSLLVLPTVFGFLRRRP